MKVAHIVSTHKRETILAGILVGLLTLVFVPIGAVVSFSGGSNPLSDNIAWTRLPNEANRIAFSRMDNESLTVSSMFAQSMCGKTDPNKVLMAAGDNPEEEQELYTLPLEGTRLGMKCGDLVRKSLVTDVMAEISFEQESQQLSVNLFNARLDFQANMKHNFSGFHGFCSPDEEKETECGSHLPAAFQDEDVWISGSFVAVDDFARARASSKESTTTNIDILQKVTEYVGMDDYTLVAARPDRVNWSVLCRQMLSQNQKSFRTDLVDADGAYDEAESTGQYVYDFIEKCFPDNQENIIKSINMKLSAVALNSHFLKVKEEKDNVIRHEITMLFRDEDTAADMFGDVQNLLQDWRAHVDNNESDMIEMVREYEGDKSVVNALIDANIRSISQSKVSLDDAFVTMVFEAELNDRELSTYEEALQRGASNQQARLAILSAILDGSEIPLPLLSNVVGEATANQLLQN